MDKGYNERLFHGNRFRSYIHFNRFYWLSRHVKKLNLKEIHVIELGCYDAKTIHFLEKASVNIQRYVGLDANWEGGLDDAREMWASRNLFEFAYCSTPEGIDPYLGQDFNVGICMETLEHVDAQQLELFLQKLSCAVRGYLFFTVPIERGLIFFIKHSIKKLLRMEDDLFTRAEFFYSVIGKMEHVRRREHKGFDDRAFRKLVGKYFDVISVTGICPGIYPISLNFGVGIIAKTKDE